MSTWWSVPLPHYRGPADVFHLMSIISPVDRDLAVVYSPLMPVPFREWLIAPRAFALVEVPDEEFESMGANVLAIAPRRVVMLDGNPVTRARLEAPAPTVLTYDGSEISVKGGGGPTCLTRPLERRRQTRDARPLSAVGFPRRKRRAESAPNSPDFREFRAHDNRSRPGLGRADGRKEQQREHQHERSSATSSSARRSRPEARTLFR